MGHTANAGALRRVERLGLVVAGTAGLTRHPAVTFAGWFSFSFAADKLLSAHTTTAAAERNWSAWGCTYTSLHANFSLETAEKAVYVKAKMPEKWYS